MAGAATTKGVRRRRPAPVGVWVVDTRVLEGLAALNTELGEALLDGLLGRLLRERVGDSFILLGRDVATEAEEKKLAVVFGGPSHLFPLGPGTERVDEATARASVGILPGSRIPDVGGIVGEIVWKS
jgi:hypothetical protein